MSEQWFLAVDGIAGESTERHHPGQIEVREWAWGLHDEVVRDISGTVSATPAGLDDLRLVARTSAATLRLAAACAAGTHIATATLTGRKVGRSAPVFLTLTLRDVLVTSVRLSAGITADALDTFTLRAAAIDAEYVAQSASGGLSAPVREHFGSP